MFKVNNKDTSSGIFIANFTSSGIFIADFEYISHFFLNIIHT